SGKNPLKRITRGSDTMPTIKKMSQRQLHKAFLRYHDPDNWPALRLALKKLGRADLIGTGKLHLVPPRQPARRHQTVPAERPGAGGRPFATQHNGLPRTPALRKGRSKTRG
ncbi:MAG: DUF3362 domain-containing protein, partial [Halioglobus sp.]|nr:DUF3362 domain-containing protein [Halioglobus sp.]